MLYIVGVGGEVGTRSGMCLEVGRCGYMGMLLCYNMSMLIWLPYYVCRNYMYTYAYPNIYIYIYSVQYCTNCGFYGIVGSLIYSICSSKAHLK